MKDTSQEWTLLNCEPPYLSEALFDFFPDFSQKSSKILLVEFQVDQFSSGKVKTGWVKNTNHANYFLFMHSHRSNETFWINYVLFSLIFFKGINVTISHNRCPTQGAAACGQKAAECLVKSADMTVTGIILQCTLCADWQGVKERISGTVLPSDIPACSLIYYFISMNFGYCPAMRYLCLYSGFRELKIKHKAQTKYI